MEDKHTTEKKLRDAIGCSNDKTAGFNQTDIESGLNACGCPILYSVEGSINGLQLFYGRCGHRHGYNLCTITDQAHNFNVNTIIGMLNKADELQRFYLNGIELITGGCDAHSGVNTPPWPEFQDKYIRCPVCDYHEIEALRHQVLLLADRLDDATKQKGV